MTSVTLRPKLAEQLRPKAERRQTSIEELVNDWLEDDLWEQRIKKIHEEAERYYAVHAQLRARYADKVIAMRDGEVVDSGDELLEVYDRVRERFGDEPILITRVGVEAIETYTIRSPRLETPQTSPLLDGPQQQTDVLDDATANRIRTRREG